MPSPVRRSALASLALSIDSFETMPPLASVPRLAITQSELMAMRLDHRAGFIVSFVDGTYTVEMILDVCPMPRERALAILGELEEKGIIDLD
jgi:hypothetical protein